jgi:hypothetical protein
VNGIEKHPTAAELAAQFRADYIVECLARAPELSAEQIARLSGLFDAGDYT